MKYEITEEQIKKLKHNADNKFSQLVSADLKNWFPEVFEIKLEVGKWYKDIENGHGNLLFCFQGKYSVSCDSNSFGFTRSGVWHENLGTSKDRFSNYVPATDSEVLEALKNEFKKRNPNIRVYDWIYNSEQNILGIWLGDGRTTQIFNNGVWTIFHTKEEAEKMLNAKIV